MMSVLRILYVVCWRNRLLIPLIISCATFAMVVTMFYHGSSEEPNVAHQRILAKRHKVEPRQPHKNPFKQTKDEIPEPPNDDSMAGSKLDSETDKKLGSHIPDPDELAKKLNERLKNNRNKEKEGLQQAPDNPHGKSHVVNPEQGKFDVAKDKWRRNRPNMESNLVFPQQGPDLHDAKLKPSQNVPRNAEKRVNDFLLNQKIGKTNDFFHVRKEKLDDTLKHPERNSDIVSKKIWEKEGKDPVKSLLKSLGKADQRSLDKFDPMAFLGGNKQGKAMQENHEMTRGINNDLSKLANIKIPSAREIVEKYAIIKNLSIGIAGLGDNAKLQNYSSKINNTMVNLQPVIFKPGMPVSKHKHKRKVVNFDIKPHRHPKIFKPYHSKNLYRNSSAYLPDHLSDWLHDEEQFCEQRLKAYHGEFAHLTNVVLDKTFAEGNKGGETIQSVLNQPEEDEYYQYMYGFFQIPCTKKPDYFFNNNNHINQWLFATRTISVNDKTPVDVIDTKFTIAVVRYEYVNIYHSMTDFYNAFLMMEFFNKTQSETNIVVIDGHPKGTLDGVWDILFNSSQRISQLPKRTKYTNLVWGMLGYNSPMMDHYAFKLPLVEEFRRFFLASYHVNDSHKLSCDHLTITFIWRRDYVAHPRNPTGTVSRKIANEEELVEALHNKYPNYTIQGMQIDLFDMHDQLQTIAHTDILIGMHGAGLTHAMFLPSHGGLVELLPVYWAAANEHFEAIARWRQLLYQRWMNVDSQYEIREHVTKIPPDVLTNMVTSIISDMCGGVKHRVYPAFGNETQ